MNGPKIVLAEDEAIVGIEIKNSLQRMGYPRIDLVSSAEGVFDELQQEIPDLVLMDINLDGDIDGIEATKEILDEHDVPIVFVTAYSSQDVLERIRETDALGYIVKPINDSDLQTISKKVIEGDNGEELDRGTFFMRFGEWIKKLTRPVVTQLPSVTP